MTLQELEQVKKDLANGIIISKATWAKVLEWTIEVTDHHEYYYTPKDYEPEHEK